MVKKDKETTSLQFTPKDSIIKQPNKERAKVGTDQSRAISQRELRQS